MRDEVKELFKFAEHVVSKGLDIKLKIFIDTTLGKDKPFVLDAEDGTVLVRDFKTVNTLANAFRTACLSQAVEAGDEEKISEYGEGIKPEMIEMLRLMKKLGISTGELVQG